VATKAKSHPRTTSGLRDVLFDEIERMQGKDADPQRARAVANLSREIINTARVEIEFQRALASLKNNGGEEVALGTLALGSR
jgi:hypothetical protein